MLPEVSELEVVRHFTKLSQLNFSIDTHFYPLGSCTMKYNPKACNSVRDAAGVPQPSSARARIAGPGLPRLHVRAAGDAEGSHRHAGRVALADGRRARRVRRRRDDPRLSPRARRSRAQRDHRARCGARHQSGHRHHVRLRGERDPDQGRWRHRRRSAEARRRAQHRGHHAHQSLDAAACSNGASRKSRRSCTTRAACCTTTARTSTRFSARCGRATWASTSST